ncbi:hypothetical protein AU468_07580 [Alkalispirochaeta sphaeroplastigenens]|uniref:DUF115 domain-containing protein n=1 Tax=Alkalispirochaeta sphaeroplastigenens TaxID=1187066 RepID=A0A2S4JQJ4_9SPIO|nr:hypothetical protein [Alkalispirochaeta sphaeroplastigenens]POR01807.1 hypothetical protein AU468_07580 [Alkalispirochaeta sphaeroplastigenens]
MHLEYRPARSGEETLLAEGILLHSSYDPQREARRFAQALSLDHPRGTALLLGDGTGVVSRELREYYPSLRVIGLRPSPGGVSLEGTEPEIPLTRLEGSLRNSLAPLEVTAIQVISWPGASRAIPRWVEQVERSVLAVLRSLQAELATTASFGRVWLTNALRRTLGEERRSTLHFQGEGLLLAAAGPSLEQLHRFPRPARGGSTAVIAASSASLGLGRFGLSPALTLHTDGGFWASRYTRSCRPAAEGRPEPVLALPLRASPCQSVRHSPANAPGSFLYRTGWVGEELAPDAASWPFLQDQPTVGASLLALAHHLAPRAHLVVAGLDLCSRDLQNHARPHWNDRYLALATGRLSPGETLRFQRLGPPGQISPLFWQDGTRGWQNETLALYREPVETVLGQHRRSGTVSFLSPSPVWSGEPALPPGTPLPRGVITTRDEPRPSPHRLREGARHCLLRWQEELRDPPRQSPGQQGPAKEQDRAARERLLSLLLHLAPVEAIHWYRGTSSWESVARASDEALKSLLKLAGTFSP